MHEVYDNQFLTANHPQGEVRCSVGPRIGIIGGGQLARMTAVSALQLGCDVVVLERNRFSPAATLATHSLVGDWNTMEALNQLASQVDLITLENEFVNSDLLLQLEQSGHTVLPSSRTISLVQDKFLQKQMLESVGLPIPQMRLANSPADVSEAIKELGLPLLLKTRRDGYDGKGNATIRNTEDIESAWEKLGGNNGNALFVEQFCSFTTELAVIITRGRTGELATYPIVETVQKNHVCHLVRAPASIPSEVADRAAEIARNAIIAVDAVGSFGVEMFLMHDGEIVINELAPRVHNSGHYTIEACVCSQFENHVRAVLGLPLGSTQMIAPAAAMVNLLGNAHSPGRAIGMGKALEIPNAHLHLYGKAASGPGRKMGHVTALGATQDEAELAATRCASEIHFGEEL
ncbi:MAG: 5-(carboxyamino)imidazole ribonucleotide synthase [Gloeobacteraceae cyanobacterium ES-bin-144]|nr:5-(carboxyamino)imidazole ribonucleotide synthase [Verrucomicrobiales bacterium]